MPKKSTSISPDGGADNGRIPSQEWIYFIFFYLQLLCTDVISACRDNAHMSTVSGSLEVYNVSFLLGWNINDLITICVLNMSWIRICPFICPYWTPSVHVCEFRPWPTILRYIKQSRNKNMVISQNMFDLKTN